jgi:importin subunit alpha-6/7
MAIPPGLSITRNVSWCLTNLCRGKPVAPFFQTRPALIALSKVLIENQSKEIISDVVWAFSYTTDASKECFKTIIECKLIPRLIELMEFPDMGVSVPALRTVGNILTGTDEET